MAGLAQPTDLRAHLRYPDDLFKVQRSILADYHVQNPTTFFNDSDNWDIPNNPNQSARTQPPYRLVISPTPGATPVYSLTSEYTPYGRSNLTAYLALDGGGTVNVTGRVKAASSLQSGRSNGTSTVGQTSGGNTLNISGVGQVIAVGWTWVVQATAATRS